MMSSSTSPFVILECLVQSRLGALDRVLGALTHRGMIPHRMETFLEGSKAPQEQGSAMRIRIEFACSDENAISKLVRFLAKQVYILEANAAFSQKASPQTNPHPANAGHHHPHNTSPISNKLSVA